MAISHTKPKMDVNAKMTPHADMLKAGSVNKQAIEYGFSLAKPGVKLRDIDNAIHKFILWNGCTPAFKDYCPPGYKIPFPGVACMAPNDVVVHGIPGDFTLVDGTLLTIDLGTNYNGWFADSADARIIGKSVDPMAEFLLEATNAILNSQLSVIKDGCTFYDLIQAASLAANKYSVTLLPKFCGHYIGQRIHMEPSIPNAIDPNLSPLIFRLEINKYKKLTFKTGDTICIEPVVTFDSTKIVLDPDQWTVRTHDGRLACHVEKCVVITEKGHEVIS